jgi:hypothetical protein
MKRILPLLLLAVFLASCGDNKPPNPVQIEQTSSDNVVTKKIVVNKNSPLFYDVKLSDGTTRRFAATFKDVERLSDGRSVPIDVAWQVEVAEKEILKNQLEENQPSEEPAYKYKSRNVELYYQEKLVAQYTTHAPFSTDGWTYVGIVGKNNINHHIYINGAYRMVLTSDENE